MSCSPGKWAINYRMDDSLDPHIQHVLGWNASETLWNTSVKHESMGQNSNHIITWFSPCPGRFRSNFKSKNKRRKQKQYTPPKTKMSPRVCCDMGGISKTIYHYYYHIFLHGAISPQLFACHVLITWFRGCRRGGPTPIIWMNSNG